MLFSEDDKVIINKLIDSPGSLYGDVIKDYLPEDVSIFCHSEKKVVAIWWDKPNNHDVSPIISFISLFSYLNSNRMLFWQSCSEERPVVFSRGEDYKVVVTPQNDEFVINGSRIKITSTNLTIENPPGNIVQNVPLCSNQLSKLLIDSLCCMVYPTSPLIELKNNDFKPIDIYLLEEQMKSTRKSLRMAWTTLFISLILPFAMTFFNNCYSKSTITDSQMTSFEQQMGSVNDHLDSIENHLNNIELISSHYRKCFEH